MGKVGALMAVKRHKFAAADTLVEIMVAMLVLAIAAIGALGYQYHATGHARIGRAQITATRTAQLLLEDWMSTGGSEEYDPSTLGLGFSSPLSIPDQWSQEQGSPLNDGVYGITVDNLPMLAMLSWEDVAEDTIAETKLRQLVVTVRFGDVTQLEQETEQTYPEGWLENVTPVILTTHVRIGASAG